MHVILSWGLMPVYELSLPPNNDKQWLTIDKESCFFLLPLHGSFGICSIGLNQERGRGRRQAPIPGNCHFVTVAVLLAAELQVAY